MSVFGRVVIPAAVLAALVTMYLGRGSSETALGAWFQYFSPWPYGFLDWLTNTVILVVLALISVWAFQKARSALKTESVDDERVSTKYRLFDDVPVSLKGTDELDRNAFVETLSRTVVLPPRANSLVLALEAPWGAGKSSVLALLRREIAGHPDEPLVVNFNPWLATGHDRIFRAFFSQFSAALLDEGEKELADGLVSFGETLEELLPSGARVLPRIGFNRFRRLLGRIPIVDLEGEKQSLCDAVADTGRPLVVIIDDLDRLAPDDIKVVFQLVKAVADFPRVAYVLAFDPEPIDRALSFGTDDDKGRQFRDKIVQANISLPRISYRTRKQFFTSKLSDRLRAWQISLSQREERLLERAVPIVLAALRTPRDMKRVINKTLITSEGLRDEVNFADILVFETLHAKYPKIADLIRSNPRVVDPSGYGDEELSGSEISAMVRERMDEEKGKSEKLKEFVGLYPEDQQAPSGLLQFAFPPIFEEMPDAEDHDLSGDRRIAVHQNLLKLLYLGVHGDLLSAQEAAMFFSEKESRSAILGDTLEARSLPAWLAHLRQFVPSASISEPANLIRDIVLAVNSLYQKARIDASSDARWLLLDILEKVSAPDRERALEELLGNRDTASVGEEVLTSLLRDAGLWDNGEYFGIEALRPNAPGKFESPTPEILVELMELWLSTVRGLGIRHVILFEPNAVGVLFRWGQLSEPAFAEVKSELDNALDDSMLIGPFLELFPPGISLDGTEKLIHETAWRKLREAFDSVDVSDAIKNKFIEYYDGNEPTRLWPPE